MPSLDTRFGLRSISKVLTTTAAVRLADQGALDLDTPIETWLKDFRHPGQGITIRRIAAHPSGLSDTFSTTHSWTIAHCPTVEQAYRDIMREAALIRPPGSRVEYATGLFTVVRRQRRRVRAGICRRRVRRKAAYPHPPAAASAFRAGCSSTPTTGW